MGICPKSSEFKISLSGDEKRKMPLTKKHIHYFSAQAQLVRMRNNYNHQLPSG